jgi:hypothetical protein
MGLLRRMTQRQASPGAARAVAENVARRHALEWPNPEAAEAESRRRMAAWGIVPVPEPARAEPTRDPDEQDGLTAQLERLADLRARGELSEEEFAAAKAKLLGGG